MGGSQDGVSPGRNGAVGAPSDWIVRFAPLVPRIGAVLDVACGGGRHLRHFRRRGYPVVGLDIDVRGLSDLADQPDVVIVAANIEADPWPLPGRRFAAIVVANYLHRPLLPVLLDALAPGGVLLYETFAMGNARYGRPSSPAFLLRNGELLDLAQGRLQVVAYEHGEVSSPKAAIVQRIVAVNDLAPGTNLDGDPEPRPVPAL